MISEQASPIGSERQFRITFANVPEGLRGVPLPIDIINEGGKRAGISQILSEEASVTHRVGGTGRYIVSAQLPSGVTVSQPVVVAEQDPSTTTVTLDFGELSRPENQTREVVISKIPRLSGSFFLSESGSLSPLTMHFSALQRSTDSIRGPRYWRLFLPQICFFQGWADKTSTPYDEILLERIASNSGQTILEHPGRDKFRPALLTLEDGISSVRSIVVWPPTDSPPPSVLFEQDWQEESLLPPILAFEQIDDPVVDTLFSFVQGQSLETARRLTPYLIQISENLLFAKSENPIYATIAAYTLLKVRSDTRQSWVRNLADRFEFLPDGAVIYAWYLLFDNEAEEAERYFQLALKRGLPMYSEGLRLLRDGLQFLCGLKPEDKSLRAQSEGVARICAVANFDSQLTCLRLGIGFSATFE